MFIAGLNLSMFSDVFRFNEQLFQPSCIIWGWKPAQRTVLDKNARPAMSQSGAQSCFPGFVQGVIQYTDKVMPRSQHPNKCWCIKGFRPHVPCHHIREYRYACGIVFFVIKYENKNAIPGIRHHSRNLRKHSLL